MGNSDMWGGALRDDTKNGCVAFMMPAIFARALGLMG